MQQKPKAIFTIFTIILILVSFGLMVVSVVLYYSKSISNVVLIPSSKNVFDNSVNESAYDAGQDYNDHYQTGKDVEFSYIFPNSMDINGYIEVLNLIFNNGASTAIFNSTDIEANALEAVMHDYPDQNAVFIDDTNWSLNDYENIISVEFLSNEASFIEGILSSIYVVANYDNPSEWNVGTWGGLQIPAVVQWMSGYEQGVNWFNYYFFGTNLDGTNVDATDPYGGSCVGQTPEEGVPQSLCLDPGQQVDIIDYQGKTFDYTDNALNSNSTSGMSFFSNSFNIGEGSPYALGLINNDANVLFPIAGGQTVDALNLVAQYADEEDPMRVVGVDSDARITYPGYSDYVLSSAIKNVYLASYYSMWYSEGRYHTDETGMYENEELNPSSFIQPIEDDGWRYDDPDVSYPDTSTKNQYGDQFVGTFENGGISVTQIDEEIDNSSSNDNLSAWMKLDQKYGFSSTYSEYSNDIFGLNNFIDYSLQAQEVAKVDPDQMSSIENSSNSFIYNNSGSGVGVVVHNTSNTLAPWIPDWNGIYSYY